MGPMTTFVVEAIQKRTNQNTGSNVRTRTRCFKKNCGKIKTGQNTQWKHKKIEG